MSFQTIDNAIFESVTSDEVQQKPFLEKNYMYVQDNNPSTSYSTNQVTFTIEVFANNGKYNSHSEGLVLFPTIIKVEADSANSNLNNTDLMLALKNSNMNIIHSMKVDYNNSQVIQGIDYLNNYLTFIQHTEMSNEDELLNGSLLGYARDSSTSWSYSSIASPFGHGICNNTNLLIGQDSVINKGDLSNSGLKNRQGYFHNFQQADGKADIFNDTKKSALNVIENPANTNHKIYYYNCYIRLRDLPFFKNLPLIRSGTLRITFTLNNNVSFQIVKGSLGDLTVLPNTFVNNSGLTNPIMISASYKNIRGATGAQPSQNSSLITNVPCGSSTLAVDKNYTVSMAIGQMPGAPNGQFYEHAIRQCRLYIPHYSFSPKAEELYLSNSKRTIDYLDIDYYSFTASPGSQFNQLITNGASRMRRFIMIGYIANGQNGSLGLPPQASPFSSEPSTTSPFTLENFNVKVGGVNLYESHSIQYDYEYFLQELNGQQGINANLTNGLVSSRISLQDFNNNYHYIVVNLDRKLPENEDVAQSLSVIGTITSKLGVTFHCYIERYKTIVIDTESGAKL
jgi:hypothetical protein